MTQDPPSFADECVQPDAGRPRRAGAAVVRTPIAVHAALATVAVLFGVNYVIAKVALREIGPLDIVVMRTWGAAALLFAAALGRRRQARIAPVRLADLGALFLYSLLGASINQICFLEGLARSTATNASLVQVTIPVLTLAFAVLLRRERATVNGSIGIAVGLAGALVIVLSRGSVVLSAETTAGNLFLIASSVVYALYLVLARTLLARYDSIVVMAWVFLLSALTVSPLGMGDVLRLFGSGVSAAAWASLVFMIVGATAVPYLLNAWALARVQSSVVAVYILPQPALAVSLGRVFLREAVGPQTAIASVLVVAGVLLASRRAAPQALATER